MSSFDFLKDPNAILDYAFDWSQWLQVSETIVSSTMTVSPGIVLNSSTFTGTLAVAWLSGGTVGSPYTVRNTITTNQSRTDERTITIRVQNR